MKVIYTSPVFFDNMQPRKFKIPEEALKTYQKRDVCLLKMKKLGGIYAKPTPEYMKLRKQMLSARRKIERMGWGSEFIN